MTPLLRVPLAAKILIGIVLLLGFNEVSPGLPQTVLLLVALFLVLSRSEQIGTLISQSADAFNRALSPPKPPIRRGGPQP